MADIVIKPPTQAQLEQRAAEEKFGGFTNPLNPLTEAQNKDTEGVVPQMTLDVQVEKQPARRSGAYIIDEEDRAAFEDPNLLQQAASAISPDQNSVVGQFLGGFNRMIAALPDMAINSIVGGLEAAGIVEEGTVDRDVLTRTFNSGNYEQAKVLIPYVLNYGVGPYIGTSSEDTTLQRYAGAAGEGVGMAAPLMLSMGAAAPAVTAQAGNITGQTTLRAANQQLAKSGSELLKNPLKTAAATRTVVAEGMMAPYVTNPGTTAAIETILSGASGVGMQAEEDLFGTNTGIGAIALPLSGPALYYGGKAALTKGPIGWTFNRLKGMTTGAIDDAKVIAGTTDAGAGPKGEVAKGQIGKAVSEAATTPDGMNNIARASEIETQLVPYGPLQLTPAEQTMDAPLLATQARAERTGNPDFTRRNLERKTTALQTIQRFSDNELTGNAVEDAPLYVFNRATGEYEGMIAPIDDAMGDVTYQINLLANADTGAYPKLTDRAGPGRSIRETVVAAHTAAKEAAEKLAKQLNINNADQLASRDATAAAKQSVRDTLLTRQGEEALSYEGLPRLVRQFVESDLDRISFQDWKTYRDQVSSAIGAAAAKGNKADVRALAVLGESLDDMAVAYGRTNEKFNDFRTWYDANVITPFERSGVIQITSRGAGSTKDAPVYWIADENVANSFLQDSNTAGQFMRLFGDNPDQMRNMKAVILDEMRRVGYDNTTGKFNARQLDTYLNRNRETLTTLGLYDELADANGLVNAQLQRQAELEGRRRAIAQNKTLQAIARSQQRSDPEKLIDEALNNPALMSELRTITNKGLEGVEADEAANAFRAAVMQRLMKRAPDAMTDPKAFKQFLVDNERVLNAGFDKTHIDNMYLVADAYERVLATGLPMGAGVSPDDIVTRLTGKLGTTPAGISNRFIAVQEGRLGAKAAVGYVLSRAIRQQSSIRADALFRDMMFDPQLAKTLASSGPADAPPLSVTPQTNRRLNVYMFNTGVGYGNYNPETMATGDERFEEFTLEPNRPQASLPDVNLPSLNIAGTEFDPTGELTNQPVQPPPANNSGSNLSLTVAAPAASANTAVNPAIPSKVSAAQLFPFDPTAAAIEQRNNAGGIMSLGAQ